MGDSEIEILAVTLDYLFGTIWDVLAGGAVFVAWAGAVMFSMALIVFCLAYVRLFVMQISGPTEGEEGFTLDWRRYSTPRAPGPETISPGLPSQAAASSSRSTEVADKEYLH